MNNDFKSLPAVYNGVRFKSRTEARWAIFFDVMGVKWEYEKEGYDLGNGILYVPDFWLPPWGLHILTEYGMREGDPCWAEVKGQPFTMFEREKCYKLADLTHTSCLLLPGIPGAEYEYDLVDGVCEEKGQEYLGCDLYCPNDFDPKYRLAVDRARTASFDRQGQYIR